MRKLLIKSALSLFLLCMVMTCIIVAPASSAAQTQTSVSDHSSCDCLLSDNTAMPLTASDTVAYSFGSCDHQVSEWIIDYEPTCTTSGRRHGNCILCGQMVYEYIAPTEHSYDNGEFISGNVFIPPVKIKYTCSQCGHVEYDNNSYKYVWVLPSLILVGIGLIVGITNYIVVRMRNSK